MSFNTEKSSGCRECDLLLARYESATFELARIHNGLEISTSLCDRESRRKLTLAAFEATERQRKARMALEEHQELEHLVAQGAGSLKPGRQSLS